MPQSSERLPKKWSAGRYMTMLGFLLMCMADSAYSLTRWSSTQLLPDADLLEGGKFVISAQGNYFSDIDELGTVRPMGMVNVGIIEWVNVEAGYTGNFNLGIKARLLGETKSWMPSLALGVRNIVSHREAYLFDRMSDSFCNELFLVFGKSFDPVRIRFHLGFMSIPGKRDEQFNPFLVLEKYFGRGIYSTVEVHRRDKKFHPSLFAAWRFLKKRLEVSLGVIDITGMFLNDDAGTGSPFFRSTDEHFVRPGVWFGVRFLGGLKFGSKEGITGIEDRLSNQNSTIEKLRGEVDSLKSMLRGSSARIEHMNRSIAFITDSSMTDEKRLKALAVDRLAVLNSLYKAEPFDPDAVNKAMAELVANRDRMLPALYDIVFDPVQETRIRTLAITALGEIGSQAAADMVIGILGQSPDPEMTIECLIALGKMKETRAVYLMQQLSHDPNDDVAFTAAEILQKLEKETGVAVTPVPAAKMAPTSVPEKKIGSGEAYEQPEKQRPRPKEKLRQSEWKTVSPAGSDSSLNRLESPEFMEATVATEPQEKKSVVPPRQGKSKEVKADKDEKTDEKEKVKVSAPESEPSGSEKVQKEIPVEKKPAPEKPAEKSRDTVEKKSAKKDIKKGEKKPADKKEPAPAKKRKRIDTESETW